MRWPWQAEPGPATAPKEFHTSTLESIKLTTRLQQLAFGTVGAMELPAVYRGVQLLTDIISSMPWGGITGGEPSMTGQGAIKDPASLDPQPMLLVQPNPSQSRDQTIRDIVISMIWHGNGYLFLNGFDPDTGRPTMVEPLDPNRMSVSWNAEHTRRIFRFEHTELELGFNLAWFPMNLLPGAAVGISPIAATGESISAGIEAEKFGRDLFQSGGVPTGVVQVPGKMTKAEANAFRDDWNKGAAEGRGPAVLSGGMTYENISLTPDQAQFILSKAWSAQQVARALGIPQWFLNAGAPPGTASALTYQNLQQVFVELARTTLIPTYLRPIERAFSSMLPRGQQVRFDLTEFLRADDTARYNTWDTAISGGILTVEEVRARENLPLVPERGELREPQAAPVPGQGDEPPGGGDERDSEVAAVQ